jgi:hypothetical protein
MASTKPIGEEGWPTPKRLVTQINAIAKDTVAVYHNADVLTCLLHAYLSILGFQLIALSENGPVLGESVIYILEIWNLAVNHPR